MRKILIFLSINIWLIGQAVAFSVDGKHVSVSHKDIILLNQNTCNAYNGIEKYEAWEFPPPNSYISSRVYCKLVRADDGNFRRNLFDCNNRKGKWECDLIATEFKYIPPQSANFVLLSSTYLDDAESIEVMNNVIANLPDSSIYRDATCTIDNKDRNNKSLYIVECNYKDYLEILKSCNGAECRWSIGKKGSLIN